MKIKILGKFLGCLQDWMIPLVEVLMTLPLLLTLVVISSPILHEDNFYICSLGKFMLETAIIKHSLILLIIAFLYFIAKIVAAFFMIKKFKCGYISTILLYFLDMITSLVCFCTSETSLQERSVEDLFVCVSSMFLAPAIICFLMYSFLGKLQKKRKTKSFKIFTSFVFSTAIIAVGVLWFNGNKQIATDNEIATLNRCYEYSEQYLYEALPDDKDRLEKMLCDIEEVFNKELFFTAFNKSKYFDRLKEIQKTETPERPVQIKSGFANELMYLKSKILLNLDKNDEYIDYYIETRRWFSTAEVESFYTYLEKDIHNYSEDDCEILKKACVEFMDEDVNRVEKLWATVDYSIVEGKDLQEEQQQEIAKNFREEYITDYSIEQIKEDILKERKYEASKRTLYMLK